LREKELEEEKLAKATGRRSFSCSSGERGRLEGGMDCLFLMRFRTEVTRIILVD